MRVTITRRDVRDGIRRLHLSARPVCVHASMRSFGHVAGGAATVLEAFLEEGCTVLVPAFTAPSFGVPPPGEWRPARNGWNYDQPPDVDGVNRVYRPDMTDLNPWMGALARAVVEHPERTRGDHALNSFAAVGPQANELTKHQASMRVYAPLEALVARHGDVLLIGVGLTSMTLIHLAEARAERRLFIRWANGPDGIPTGMQTGSCSDGFEAFEAVLAAIERETRVGPSQWRAYPAAEVLTLTTDAIIRDPEITRCDDPDCERCRDASAGGPLLHRQ